MEFGKCLPSGDNIANYSIKKNGGDVKILNLNSKHKKYRNNTDYYSQASWKKINDNKTIITGRFEAKI